MLRRFSGLGLSAAVAIGVAFPQLMVHAQRGLEPRSLIIGSWRVVSYEVEFQDGTEHRFPLSAHPNGYLLFGSDGRMMAYLEAEGRKAPQTDEERSAAYRTLSAYTGRYRVQGDKWITTVDGAWNVEWVGTEQVTLASRPPPGEWADARARRGRDGRRSFRRHEALQFFEAEGRLP